MLLGIIVLYLAIGIVLANSVVTDEDLAKWSKAKQLGMMLALTITSPIMFVTAIVLSPFDRKEKKDDKD